jgi:hypothetical protein
MNVIVPVAVLGETVAVKLTVAPANAGFAEEVSEVVVAAPTGHAPALAAL